MENSLQRSSSRPVANWILLGVFMLLVQVILGGITRLTGSGLSITEWNVVTGALPPLNNQQWMNEFEKYKHTPQYNLLNPDFSLSDFKFIFFWEWFHRFWARMIGIVFIAGFIYLLIKKSLKQEMIIPLIILFLIGAMQGTIGWIMVKSGFDVDSIYVKPTKLALHFIFALGLICYALWFALQLIIPPAQIVRNNSLRKLTWFIIFILFFQLLYGALMAGHKAANAAPTWPTINGDFFPPSLFKLSPAVLNFINNKITVHFMHRGLAYLLFILILIFTFRISKLLLLPIYIKKSRNIPLLIVCVQILLGITAVLTSPQIIPNHWGVFEWIAELHQITGMLFLLIMIYMLYIIRPVKH
jgi:heme a synthase